MARRRQKGKRRRPLQTTRCQFCGKATPARDWKQGGDECPKCGRLYDYILAQDDP